jgi:DNA-binding transcriptional regulator YiaG
MDDAHHYTESGLNNVFIHGMQVELDDDGDRVMTIPAIGDLHRVISEGIVSHRAGISGAELRFLRTEIGMTQAELAALLHRDKQSVGRWERGEIDIDSASEALVRKLAIERLNLQIDLGIDELSARSVRGADVQPIDIDIKADNDGPNYELRVA